MRLAAGLAAWRGAAVLVLSRAWRIGSVESAAGMLVIGFIGVHSLVELPHHYLYFLIPAGLWAGIVEREERPARREAAC